MSPTQRFLRIFTGFLLLMFSLPLVFLPIPGVALATLTSGLVLLAAEYVWAARFLLQISKQSARLRHVLFLKLF